MSENRGESLIQTSGDTSISILWK